MSPQQIRRLMKTLGLTQQQLADKIGAHRVTIADWVRGANKPKGLYLKALEDLAEKVKKKRG
jgi:DNA-binding transcriptional regulator YiaG